MIEILDPGPLTTVQDLGRFGFLRFGIPPSGPMDRDAFVAANLLVGNSHSMAALECTLIGPRFRAHAQCAIAVTGAEMPVTMNAEPASRRTVLALQPGDVVRIGPARTGVRGYIAFRGGIDVPLVMGSRSTYLRGGLGGLEGRALRKGDRLKLLPALGSGHAPLETCRAVEHALAPSRGEGGGEGKPSAPAHHAADVQPGEGEIRIVLGPQADRFTERGIAAFLGSPYEMLPQSDRMGARLRGASIAHVRGHDIVSDGIALGSVQVAGDGQPIVLLVDRQSTGGYTKIATVCSFDIGRIAQTRPGQSLRFRTITLDEAHNELRRAYERSVNSAPAGS